VEEEGWRCPARGARNALNAPHRAALSRTDAARRRAACCAGLARASQSIREMKQVPPTYCAHAQSFACAERRRTRRPASAAAAAAGSTLLSAALLTELPRIALPRPCGECSSAHRTRGGAGRSAAPARSTSWTPNMVGRSAAPVKSTVRTLSARCLAFDRARHPPRAGVRHRARGIAAGPRRCIYVDKARHPPRAAARRCLFLALALALALPRPRLSANARAPSQALRTQRSRTRTGCCQAFRTAILSTRASSSKGAGSRFTSTRQNVRPAYGR